MGTKNNPGAYDCYANADPDEPMFILLGRDPFAANLVEEWARRRETERGPSPKLDEARACANAMRNWRARPVARERVTVGAGDVGDLASVLSTERRAAEVPGQIVANGVTYVPLAKVGVLAAEVAKAQLGIAKVIASCRLGDTKATDNAERIIALSDVLTSLGCAVTEARHG